MKSIRNNRSESATRKSKLLSFKNIFLGGVFLLVGLNVFFGIQLASTGAGLVQLEQTKEQLLKENAQLAEQAINSRSLLSLEKEAKVGGFIQPSSFFYIKLEEAVATAR